MRNLLVFLLALLFYSCEKGGSDWTFEAFETSASGHKMKEVFPVEEKASSKVIIKTEEQYQSITGFGGAFTESSAYLLNELSEEKRFEILNAYFSKDGSNYSLCRTHMNSCDFSLDHYSYAEVESDTLLEHFSIDPDKDDIIPMILDAQRISEDRFKIIASPWTAPPWMKDNKGWYGGKLLTGYYDTWALFFSKYYQSFKDAGIDIWGFTVENEPLGNDAHWESMHYTPEEMADFVKNHLGPQLEKDQIDAKLLVYDQNRGDELEEWASVLLTDSALLPYVYGTAVHWYTSTFRYFPKSLNYVHELAPEKHIIHTEACVDAEIPHWKDDDWYWQKEATDWGYEWAKEENKINHPKYVPTYRYARDIIGCMNNWVEGWIDWNMVLDQNGGPNLANNWCIAPVLVNTELDEVYYTPLYYVLQHFSKFIRPGAIRIGVHCDDEEIMCTAVKNLDGSLVLVLFNPSFENKFEQIVIGEKSRSVQVSKQSIQTVVITP